MLIQEWLQRHGPFDAVVDGANLGLANQRTFNFGQVNIASVAFLSMRMRWTVKKKLAMGIVESYNFSCWCIPV